MEVKGMFDGQAAAHFLSDLMVSEYASGIEVNVIPATGKRYNIKLKLNLTGDTISVFRAFLAHKGWLASFE